MGQFAVVTGHINWFWHLIFLGERILLNASATDQLEASCSSVLFIDNTAGLSVLVPTRRMFKAALTSLSTNLLESFPLSPRKIRNRASSKTTSLTGSCSF